MDRDIYYYFRQLGLPDDSLICLSMFDRSPFNSLNRSGAIFLRANGLPVATVRAPHQATYPQYVSFAGIEPSAYIEGRLSTIKSLLQKEGSWVEGAIISFDCVTASGDRLSEAATFGLPVQMPYALPEMENTKRVGGKISLIGYENSGASWYLLLQNVLRGHFKNNLPKRKKILDWGVGCGRIARYFLHAGYENLTGIDIDSYNVNWCQKNLSQGTFAICDYEPPTDFPDNSFDVIYGHSVFTHLAEKDEHSWLGELNRLLSPKGIAVCTISSEFGSYMSSASKLLKNPSFLSRLWAEGRMDFGALDVGVDADKPGYYRLVAHTREYIRRVWSHRVEVLRIIPGFADNQDAVVFKKRFARRAPTSPA